MEFPNLSSICSVSSSQCIGNYADGIDGKTAQQGLQNIICKNTLFNSVGDIRERWRITSLCACSAVAFRVQVSPLADHLATQARHLDDDVSEEAMYLVDFAKKMIVIPRLNFVWYIWLQKLFCGLFEISVSVLLVPLRQSNLRICSIFLLSFTWFNLELSYVGSN